MNNATQALGSLDVKGARVGAAGFDLVASIISTDAIGVDIGAGLSLGGLYNNSGPLVTPFAEIAGVKSNATSGNYDGVMLLKTRVNGGNMTTALRIDAAQRVTLPLQPSFSAYKASDVGSVSANTDVVCDTETRDQTASYNPATGIFTAPESGTYLILGAVGITTLNSYVDVSLVTSSGADFKDTGVSSTNGTTNVKFCHIIYMVSGETVKMRVTDVSPSGTCTVLGGGYTWFSGQLIA